MTGRSAIIMMILGFALSPQSATAASETLTHHGNYRDWQVFRLVRDDLTACYAASQASQFFPRGSTRMRPVLYVVRYPETTAKNTIEFRFGADISNYESVTAKLIARRKQPRDSFALATKATTGFIAKPAEQTPFIKAMRKGRQIVVVSQPGVGDILEDRYSLFGVTKALARLEALCPGPQPKQPPALKGALTDSTPVSPAGKGNPPKDAPE